jgi:hypothetical protein
VNIGLDVDGTIDAFPVLFQHLIAGWHAAGDHVYVITGTGAESGGKATDADYAAKAQYLTAMGIPPSSYYQLVVLAHSPTNPVADQKAQFIKDNGIDVLIDNNVDNCKAAKPYCLSLLAYNVKEKGDVAKPTNTHS